MIVELIPPESIIDRALLVNSAATVGRRASVFRVRGEWNEDVFQIVASSQSLLKVTGHLRTVR